MKKKLVAIIIGIAILLAGLIYYQRPLLVMAYDWGHAILGGLYSGTGVPLKVDSEGQVYVNMSGMNLLYTGANRGGVSTIVSGVSKLRSANLAFAILKLSGAEKTFTMAAGDDDGQEITLVKCEHDARTLKLAFDIEAVGTNTTHTGFNSVTWPTEAGSFISLTWIDDTLGWILTGSGGDVTIEYE